MRLTQVTYKEFCTYACKFLHTYRFTLDKVSDRGKLLHVNRPHYMGHGATLVFEYGWCAKNNCKYFISYNVRKER